MKKFYKDLRKHLTKIINYEKKASTNKENQSYRKKAICYICREISTDDKKYYKVRNHCHHTGKYTSDAQNICDLRYKTPKEIPVIFHNSSNYD